MMAPENIYQIQAVARKNDLSLIYLFGSQAERGLNYLEGSDVLPAENSDLDIAIAFRNPPVFPMETYGRLYREADEIFHPFDIDLIFMHEVDIFLQYEIIRGVRIYEADASLAELFEERIMKSAGDLVVKKRTMDHEIMEAIEDGYFQFEYTPRS